MKINKMASVPLILQDPFVSIWSSFDKLNDGDTTHWCGMPQKITGTLSIDGKAYAFLGTPGILPAAEQVELELTATTTTYTFKADGVYLKAAFCSPMLLDQPLLVSRPCTYLDFQVWGETEGKNILLTIGVTPDVVTASGKKIVGGGYRTPSYSYAYMGSIQQAPLSYSGDNCTIDWGNVFLASDEEAVKTYFDSNAVMLYALADLTESGNATIVYAFDDINSIQYFGDTRKGYWTTVYDTIYQAIDASLKEHDQLVEECAIFDVKMEEMARAAGGDDYVFLCNASYRHSIAAHKLIQDNDGNLIFLSKENDSNGCIGTVDVSYPSVPLYLLFNTEYVKGMLRPIFRFAACDVWEYDFAPHDVGRYPYATGQVYGLNMTDHAHEFNYEQGTIHAFNYQFPAGSNVFDFRYQMPVEECGNMLILMAVIMMMDGNTDFCADKMDVLEKWVVYLQENGMDPGEQLCTDDFAGHLAHNTNLSVKAILGIEAFALIKKEMGDARSYEKYHKIAQDMAKNWEKTAAAGDHTRLTFDKEDSWSLKYNLVWDIFFKSGLFSEEVYRNEIRQYQKMNNEYGVPLDSRCAYTKSDWILWCCALTDDIEIRKEIIGPVANYLENTSTRKPFSDWYDTITGKYYHFIARSVQGGIFMPIFIDKMKG